MNVHIELGREPGLSHWLMATLPTCMTSLQQTSSCTRSMGVVDPD